MASSMAHSVEHPGTAPGRAAARPPRLPRVRSFARTASRALARAAAFAALLALAVPAHAAAPAVGSQAPNFRLQDQDGKWHTLDQYRGRWVVLYFYPKDDTPGCTTQACELRDNIFAFRQANATILGISVDDVASHAGFAKEHGLPFRILADPTKQTAKAYGVLMKLLVLELAQRDTFLIDPQGRIAKHWSKVDPDGHSAMVLAELKAQQAKAAAAAPAATAPATPPAATRTPAPAATVPAKTSS